MVFIFFLSATILVSYIFQCLSYDIPYTFMSQQKQSVSNLMGTFVSGLVGLMGSLVQGLTKMQTTDVSDMAQQFSNFAQGLGGANPSSSHPIGGATRSSAAANMGGSSAGLIDNLPEDEREFEGDDVGMDDVRSERESSGDELIGDYILASRKQIGEPHEDLPDNAYCAVTPHDRNNVFHDSTHPEKNARPTIDTFTAADNVGADSFAARGSEQLDDSNTHTCLIDFGENNAPSSKNGVEVAAGASNTEVHASSGRDIVVVFKRRIQTIGQKHSKIVKLVTSELGLRAPTVQSLPSDKPNDKPKLKKNTPRRYDHLNFLLHDLVQVHHYCVHYYISAGGLLLLLCVIHIVHVTQVI